MLHLVHTEELREGLEVAKRIVAVGTRKLEAFSTRIVTRKIR